MSRPDCPWPQITAFGLLVLLLTAIAPAAQGQETGPDGKPQQDSKQEIPPQQIDLAEGRLELEVPGNWKKVEPRSRIIELEFEIPEPKKDAGTARMTIMAAGGSIDANIERWIGQFRSRDGKPPKDSAKREKKQVDGLTVHTVDVSGTYLDSPRGPFGPKVEMEDHRMLAAIIPTDRGTYFIKLYGPSSTMKAAEKPFDKMVESVTWE